jgi:hypothetical protein
MSRQSQLSREHQAPRAVLNALERMAGSYGTECDRVRQELTIAESQLRDYQARLGAPFLHDAYLSELTELRDQLKAGLAGKTPEPGSDSEPSTAELAEKIKALKAAHSIEATPQRIRQKQVSAEEPVTTRIRRRIGANSPSDAAIPPDAPMPEAETSPSAEPTGQAGVEEESPREFPPHHVSTFRHGAPRPHTHMTFQQRLAMERQRRDLEPSLP